MDVHKNFLDKCLNDCLITNATLFPLFVSLLAVCKQFVTFIIHFDEQNGDIVISDIATFSSTISSLDKRFQENYVLFLKTLTESARLDDGGTKIFEILNRANFNHYFTKIMENLEDSHQQ
ncbi:hypothetical protein O3M35_003761 [Rhynocoris fuscipes]|uniref:Gamma tubulin complex component C-terminal domain-containing protein n=1 Tax=Rhynocoris fuscipes TaxID=488301 RepID=A0AAW1CHD3_9HEMI